MKSGKALKLARTLLLGLANGVFSSAVGVALDQVNFYYALQKYSDNLDDAERIYKKTGTHLLLYNPPPQPLWWIRVVCVNVVMFMLAALFAHLYVARKVKSLFLLWQTVSLLVIIEWALFFVTALVIDALVKGKRLGDEPMPDSYAVAFMWEYVIATLIINVVWGLVMKASAGQSAQAQDGEANPA